MATYIMLMSYTDVGIQHFKNIGDRLEHARRGAVELGAELQAFYLTMGQYDAVAVVEAPDDETAAKLSLVNAANGRVRIHTMRAFTEPETVQLASELPA
ncbi:MAG: GYD domain-containing protein [Acidimicrobiia bacterium]|nr:GYD domain-containing protein [Acidimicrobiia bacterium]